MGTPSEPKKFKKIRNIFRNSEEKALQKVLEEDVIIRNNIQKIGNSMYQHCEAFFKDVKYLNTWFLRTEIQDDYKTETRDKGKTPQSHKKSLELYCYVKGWSLTTEKKAIDPTPENGLLKRKSVEHYFIDTNPQTKIFY